MQVIQWFPVFISLLGIGRMSNIYRQSHNKQQVAGYWWNGVLATIAITLYWYPPLFALIGWGWPSWFIVSTHWLQDVMLTVGTAIMVEACIVVEYGTNRRLLTGYAVAHRRFVVIALVGMSLGFVAALLLHEQEDLYHYNVALNPVLIGARYIAMLMVCADVCYLLHFNSLVFYLNPDPTARLVSLSSGFALTCGLVATIAGAVTAFVRAGSSQEVPALFMERGLVFGVVVGIAFMSLSAAPRIRPISERLATHLWNITTYLSLYPLWRFMTQQQPNVVLATNYRLTGGIVRPSVMAFLVNRQVREILDARRRLGIKAGPPMMTPFETIPQSGDLSVRQRQFQSNRAGELALRALADTEARALLTNKVDIEIGYPSAYLDQIRYLRLVTRRLLRKRISND